MKRVRRLLSLMMFVFIVPLIFISSSAYSDQENGEITVLFTHDLHSHFLPQKSLDGGESGGYARLMTALERARREHPNAVTVDGGDFSVGSLIHTLNTSQAAELRTMGAMGFDAVTAGNHEFDHTGVGFAQMLYTATLSGEQVPALLMANYRPASDNPNQLDIQRAMAAYGVKDVLLLERGGIRYGIFGLMGEESDSMAPSSGFVQEDSITAARRCVEELKEQGAEFIICLSHSGTNDSKRNSEDEKLAESVNGIDLIVSGHTHTTLTTPIVVGDTYIVSAGAYCENLGLISFQQMADGSKKLIDYQLIPIDETLPEDPDITYLVSEWKELVNGSYLSAYGLTYDQKLTSTQFTLELPKMKEQGENPLGNLVADAYLWAVENLEAEHPETETIAVTAAGVLRAPLFAGTITTSQAFDVLSMGAGENGSAGFPLVSCYLTGKEVRALLEVDASVTPIMPEAQLYLSGIRYSFNTNRMFFNRVIEAKITGADFTANETHGVTELENDKLYRVVSGMYSAQMLSTVKDKSFGLLSIIPKDEEGRPIEDFNQHILRNASGGEIKEWYALAAYLNFLGDGGIPSGYAAADGRKLVSHSWNPIELIKRPNWISLVACLFLVLMIAGAVLMIRNVVRWKRNRRYNGGYRRRWFGR